MLQFAREKYPSWTHPIMLKPDRCAFVETHNPTGNENDNAMFILPYC